ncbi:MAG: poly(ribitol-phosphate) beta-N-acetylglucosaminyltransferase [Thermoleophilaceae bacterium]|nr:poly(ribitol-phosphate) beta-N-acetylglucosaminyltransferase [Thermoleophilaceae bacterium]
MIKVSVVVPVYNPGHNIDRCIATLVDQSLPKDEYEVIFVDDGSTDETPARLDELAREHEHVRVEHIPNSGWPGRPRNLGIDMANGEYVYFVDNDDHLGEEALERLYARATELDSDVVVGKIVGRGKHVPRAVFTQNRDSVDLGWRPLVRLLTPHKLFRKSLLDEHGIRFPEGRRRLEDHVFVMHAYFHARKVSILADYPCYYWVLHRGEETNASYSRFDAKGYYANVREVLDLVVEHTEPGPGRDRLLAHWYRGKMLGRVGGRWWPHRSPEFRRELFDEVSKLARERYGPESDEYLARHLRVRSYLLREGSFETLSRLAFWEAELRADVTIDPRWEDDGTLVLAFEARMVGRGDKPLLFERRGERLFWAPPEELRGELPDDLLDWTDAIPNATLHTIIRAKRDETDFVLPTRYVREIDDVKGGATVVLRGEARVEPGRAAAGAKPRAGRWELLGQLTICGFTAMSKPRLRRTAAEYEIRIDHQGAPVRRAPSRMPSVRGRLARRLPRVARVVRRAKERRDSVR